MAVAAKFSNQQEIQFLNEQLSQHNLMKEFQVQDTEITMDGVTVIFHDTVGTTKRFQAFVDWFFPVLQRTSAVRSGPCCVCGQLISGNGTWKITDSTAMHMHEACADHYLHDALVQEARERMEDTGSYGRGFLGALVVGLLGAIVWGLVLYFGYFAAIVGALLGMVAVLYKTHKETQNFKMKDLP